MRYLLSLFFCCFIAVPALGNELHKRTLTGGMTVCTSPEAVVSFLKQIALPSDCSVLTFPSGRAQVHLRGVELLYSSPTHSLVLVELHYQMRGMIHIKYGYMPMVTYQHFNLPMPGEILLPNKKLRKAEFFGGEHLYL
jgi:hypothetical protein